jgi:hypothetical protein
MELSLCLSFELSRCLGDYMVGTTTGFRVTTMQALVLWPYHQISRWYL